MLVGLFRNWDNIPPERAVPTQGMFFVAWLAVFVFLTSAILRWAMSYILVMVFVDLAVPFVLLALERTFAPPGPPVWR